MHKKWLLFGNIITWNVLTDQSESSIADSWVIKIFKIISENHFKIISFNFATLSFLMISDGEIQPEAFLLTHKLSSITTAVKNQNRCYFGVLIGWKALYTGSGMC